MDKLDSFVENSKYAVIFDRRMPSGLAGLCVDDTILINEANNRKKQLQTLAEEIAHQETTIGDIAKQATIEQRQQEIRARRMAVRSLVTLDDLIAYNALGIDSIYEAAELSDVTVDFLQNALESYREKRGDIFTYKGFIFNLTHGLEIHRLR